MNVPAIITEVEPVATREDLEEMCADYAGFWQDGILEKVDAVDCVQRHAELWGTVDALGQDEVQRVMAAAFEPPLELPTDYASQLMRQWELDDPRDAWRHTGEIPPPASIRNSDISARPTIGERFRNPPQATIDAFNYVVSLGDATYLAEWLRDHAEYAAALLGRLEETA